MGTLDMKTLLGLHTLTLLAVVVTCSTADYLALGLLGFAGGLRLAWRMT